MKKSVFVLLFLTLFAGSAMALTKGEVRKCTGKLHACFKGNYSLMVDLNPTARLHCILACNNSDLAQIGGGCETAQICQSRCEVAFDLITNMCD